MGWHVTRLTVNDLGVGPTVVLASYNYRCRKLEWCSCACVCVYLRVRVRVLCSVSRSFFLFFFSFEFSSSLSLSSVCSFFLIRYRTVFFSIFIDYSFFLWWSKLRSDSFIPRFRWKEGVCVIDVDVDVVCLWTTTTTTTTENYIIEWLSLEFWRNDNDNNNNNNNSPLSVLVFIFDSIRFDYYLIRFFFLSYSTWKFRSSSCRKRVLAASIGPGKHQCKQSCFRPLGRTWPSGRKMAKS